jgi:hypothetical protein
MTLENLPLIAYLGIGLLGGVLISFWIHFLLVHSESRRKKQLGQKTVGYKLTETDPNQQTAMRLR